jgi:VWFA-related protein
VAALAGAGAHGLAAVDTPVHTVRVDAFAVDARGAPVATLTPRDFEVREDGNLVTVEEAEFVRNSPRVVAIYLDEYHLSVGDSTDRARAAIAQFVEHELDPRDQLVVLKPLDSLLTIRLTNDRDAALSAVKTLEGRRDDLAPRTPFERASMVGTPQRIESLRTQVTISALNALALKLGTFNALRKTLLVVSERLDHAARGRGQDRLATIDGLVRSANRGHVSIYSIDPRPPSAEADADEMLTHVARDTAGRLIAGTASLDDLSAGIRSAVSESAAYYMITYRSAHEENGAFHPVQIRVKQPGVQVHARGGFWAPSADDRLRAEVVALANRPPVVVPLEPPRRSSPLIRPWFGLSMGTEDRMRVTFVWEPSTAVPGERVRTQATRVELTVLGNGDTVLFQGPVLPAGLGVASAAEPSQAVFEAPPGRLRLRMTIHDQEERQVDTDVRDLVVRDLRGKVAIGSAEVMRARTAREFRALEANPDAAPVSSRVFSRTERLLIRFPTYSPDGQPLVVAARLLNHVGQPMRTLDLGDAVNGGHQLDVPLSGLPSSDYEVEITATGAAGRDTERIDFRVAN